MAWKNRVTQPSLDDGTLQGLVYFDGDDGSVITSMFEDDNEYLSTYHVYLLLRVSYVFPPPDCQRPIFKRGTKVGTYLGRPSFPMGGWA